MFPKHGAASLTDLLELALSSGASFVMVKQKSNGRDFCKCTSFFDAYHMLLNLCFHYSAWKDNTKMA